MRFIAAAALVLAATPVMAGPIDTDGYEFRPEWNRAEFRLRIVPYETREDVRHASIRQRVPGDWSKGTRAFSVMPLRADGLCQIHIVRADIPAGVMVGEEIQYHMDFDPVKDLYRTVFRHELLHCAYGRWHR